MTQKAIGPSFSDELALYGDLIGHHFTWGSDGTIEFFDDTPQPVIDGVREVYASHDPSKSSWGHLRLEARSALDASDITITRCAEGAIEVPESWINYRKLLRIIVSAESGDVTQGLPPQPPYPVGT